MSQVPQILREAASTTSVEQFTIHSFDGTKLYSKLWSLSDHQQQPKATIIYVHGFIEYIDRYTDQFPFFPSKGIEMLAFDQRGFGQTSLSEKDPKAAYSKTSWPQQFKDIEAVIRDQRKRLDEKWGKDKVKIFLCGHSMGGGLASGFFTRPKGSPSSPSQEAQDMISGVVLSSAWLRLTHPPPSILPMIVPTILKGLPNLHWSAPLNAEHLTKDKIIQEKYRTDPLCSGKVYLKSIADPLIGGLTILKSDYKNWPANKPILILHGDDDQVTDPKGSQEFHDKIKSQDKEIKTFKGYRHECWNEIGEEKVEFMKAISDWVLARCATSTAPAAVASEVATESGCWATLLTDEKYLPGLVVFYHSLIVKYSSRFPLVVMITEKLSERGRRLILDLGCRIELVERISTGRENKLMAESRFSETWTKLRAFSLIRYRTVILVDSDMLVRKNMDELFDKSVDEKSIFAGFACTCNPNKIKSYPPEWIPSNCAFTPQVHPESLTTPTKLTPTSPSTYRLLNSGLVVLKPSLKTMDSMIERIRTDEKVDSYSFPDQDFIADFFKEGGFNPLPWYYNSIKRLRKCHENIWRDQEVRNVHYILDKPWVSGRPRLGKSSENGDEDENPQKEEDDGQDKDDRITHGWWWKEWDEIKKQDKLNLNKDQWEIVEKNVNQNSFEKSKTGH